MTERSVGYIYKRFSNSNQNQVQANEMLRRSQMNRRHMWQRKARIALIMMKMNPKNLQRNQNSDIEV